MSFAQAWNKKSLFYEDAWVQNTSIDLATDASDAGFGGVYKSMWFMEPFSHTHADMSIAWRELFAILIACTLWRGFLTGRKIRIHCDNMAVVSCVNSGTSKCIHIMKLIRQPFFVAASYGFDVRLNHIAGNDNVGPDRLSRLDLNAFRVACPGADVCGASVSTLVNILG